MPFHVEISRGFRHARAFNLDEETLRRTILDPWMRGRVIMLGDKDWEPRDCKLIILEGPELGDTDLSMGRGWSNAERSAENVTRKLVDDAANPRPAVAVLAESPSSESAVGEMLGELDRLPWSELRARILSGEGAVGAYAAVVVIDGGAPSAPWLFDAGLARGALGPGAVLVQLGDGRVPAQLSGLEVLHLEPGDPGSPGSLSDRLLRPSRRPA
jgi:hypothetical protein